jgi:hypothetical protein
MEILREAAFAAKAEPATAAAAAAPPMSAVAGIVAPTEVPKPKPEEAPKEPAARLDAKDTQIAQAPKEPAPKEPAAQLAAQDTQMDTLSQIAKLEAEGASKLEIAKLVAEMRGAKVEGVAQPVATSAAPAEAPKPKPKPKEPKRAAWREGIFAPAVLATKKVLGEQELKEFRASVIAKHSKVIGKFVDTSESKFGQLVLKRMFEYADKDGNGTLDAEEVRSALKDLGFDFLNEKQVEKLLKDADKDQNDVIDFEEFVKATPKALRINLVKLAKQNGHDLGFLV